MKNLLLITIVFVSTLACSGSDDPDGKSPCELLTISQTNSVLKYEDSAPEIKDEVLTYPTCTYDWNDISFPVVQTIGSQEITIDHTPRLTLVMVANATESMYETSIKVYSDGETLDGVGERATWGDQMTQLSLLSDGYLIHVYVKVDADADENQTKAVALAKLIVENL